jgi:hypothetical protein
MNFRIRGLEARQFDGGECASRQNQTDYRIRHVHIHPNRHTFPVALAMQRSTAATREATAHQFLDFRRG